MYKAYISRRKRGGRGYSRFKKYRSNKAFASKVGKVIRSYSEKKYYVTSMTSNNPVSCTGYVSSLVDISEGSADTNRDGDNLYVTSTNIRYEMVVADYINVMRVIVFQWYPQTIPTINDILFPYSATSSFNVLAHPNHDNRYNYRIMYDKSHKMNTVSTPVGSDNPIKLSGNVSITKGFKRKIQYVAGTTGGTNKIYVLAVSDSTTTSHPTFNFMSKVNFLDL